MVYALIPIKDRIEQTLNCLEHFKNQTYKDILIIVIDDGSIDGSSEKIKEKWNDIHILKGDGNLWCMGAFAMGIDYVRNRWRKGDFVLTQNQDTIFDSDFVSALISQSELNGRAIIGASNFSIDRKTTIYNNVIIKNGRFNPTIIKGQAPELLASTTLATRGTIFPVEVFEKIGNFSKLFPHYAGDYEVCARAKKNGFKLFSSTTAKVYSNDNNHNLAWRIKHKDKKTLKDVFDLYFSRRSSSNLYYGILLTLLHIPFPQNFVGIFRLKLVAIKFFFYEYLYKSIIINYFKSDKIQNENNN